MRDGRTHADSRFRPVRRGVSRYGMIEKALRKLQSENREKISSRDVAFLTKVLRPSAIAAIMKFTKGVERGKKVGEWVFTGEPIVVENVQNPVRMEHAEA